MSFIPEQCKKAAEFWWSYENFSDYRVFGLAPEEEADPIGAAFRRAAAEGVKAEWIKGVRVSDRLEDGSWGIGEMWNPTSGT